MKDDGTIFILHPSYAPMPKPIIFTLGFLLLIPYAAAWWLADLRQHTVGFLVAFLAAFALYAGATVLALRVKQFSRQELLVVFGLTAVMQGFLIFTPPTLSDDMYRYIWNGRVQAQGISPYQYPPDAPQLAHLRDREIWPHINRKSAITVYPPAAETAYALIWRLWPDSVRWFQIVMAAGALLAGALLVKLLVDTGRSPARVLIYLWSPLLIFETAHAAHVDGLVLPLLVGAWWARIRERDILVGVLLGVATAMKIYPILLLPALWRPNHRHGRWRLPVAFLTTIALCYLPYLVQSGADALGYLPNYFGERFNMGLAGLLIPRFVQMDIDPNRGILLLTLLALALMGLLMLLRPAADGLTAVRRSIWAIGIFTLLTQNLFSWYMLWLLPLVALFLQEGRPPQMAMTEPKDRLSLAGVLALARHSLRPDAWTGWWLFCGLVALSYTFFIRWRPVPWAIWSQFLPLYAFLLIDLVRWLKEGGPVKSEK